MANVFELDTMDVLGSQFRSYLTEIRALSLTNPKGYFTLRKELSTKTVDLIISTMYKTIFKALTKGTDFEGVPLSTTPLYGRTGGFIPGFPSQKANILAMRICEMLENELESVMQILMPLSFDNVASNSMSYSTLGSLTHGIGSSPAATSAGSASSSYVPSSSSSI